MALYALIHTGSEPPPPYSALFERHQQEFIKTLYACNFIQPFDWGSWQDEAAKYIDYPHLLDSAALETVIKLLTAHVRKERFCNGHLAWVISNGHLLKILKRLSEIRKKQAI